ncbi:hypothetical protein chiPu_0022800, partial [Chiloscyllium punctatum]|nr:hypothetical protein [Chiloscyllium punctatum]
CLGARNTISPPSVSDWLDAPCSHARYARNDVTVSNPAPCEPAHAQCWTCRRTKALLLSVGEEWHWRLKEQEQKQLEKLSRKTRGKKSESK